MVGKSMRFSRPGLVFSHSEVLGAIYHATEHGYTSPTKYSHSDSIDIVTHSSILVFGFLQAQFSELGHCKRDSDSGISLQGTPSCWGIGKYKRLFFLDLGQCLWPPAIAFRNVTDPFRHCLSISFVYFVVLPLKFNIKVIK